MKDTIRQPDSAQSVQRYQEVIAQRKVRLYLAVFPGARLMLASMIVNKESTVGYTNKLKHVVSGIKVGVNNGVNTNTEKSCLKLMEGEASKFPPKQQPSFKPDLQSRIKNHSFDTRRAKKETTAFVFDKTPSDSQHEVNKTAVLVSWRSRSRGCAVHSIA